MPVPKKSIARERWGNLPPGGVGLHGTSAWAAESIKKEGLTASNNYYTNIPDRKYSENSEKGGYRKGYEDKELIERAVGSVLFAGHFVRTPSVNENMDEIGPHRRPAIVILRDPQANPGHYTVYDHQQGYDDMAMQPRTLGYDSKMYRSFGKKNYWGITASHVLQVVELTNAELKELQEKTTKIYRQSYRAENKKWSSGTKDDIFRTLIKHKLAAKVLLYLKDEMRQRRASQGPA